jgi:AAA+ ATPase superfamily predicted ATPase
MWDIEGARKLADKILGIVQFLRHSTKERIVAFAALAAAGGATWLGHASRPKQLGFIDEALWQSISSNGSLGLYFVSVLLFCWISFLIWTRLTPPLAGAGDLRPTAIKGPMAFGPHDAELFRRLGREVDIATLLNYILNDQFSLIVVSGESGAGKTSLLRAGLPSTLKNQTPPIEYHYWEAVPDESEKRFLATVQDGWATAENAGPPQKLTDVFGPSDGAARRVIVLDQFEQLSPAKRSHRSIFQLLKHAVTAARPPHRITFIVAFRRDYAPTWLDFEHEELAGRRQLVMPLRLFTEAQAKDAMAVIADAADFTMDNALADDLVESMKNDEARVSPVDIGITLLALNERALSKPDRHLDKGDYRIAGGAIGLLAEYVSSQLDRYQPGERSAILAALLELADLSKDQRLPEGRTPGQLAENVPLATAVLERYLKDLASPQVRLLEALPRRCLSSSA